MPKVIFEGETQAEIVAQVKRWLVSTEAKADGSINLTQAVSQGADLTKDALRIIASVAPKPIAENDIVKALTESGYKATDASKKALVDGLEQVQDLTGGSVVQSVSKRGRNAVYQMNSTIAKQILKSLHNQ